MKVAVLIPSYNASATLPALLERTLAYIPHDQIVVVNDGSTDATADAAERFQVTVVAHQSNRGKGAALQTGFEHILRGKSDAVITMDADLQHEPEMIPSFIALFKTEHTDVIIGSRMHDTAAMPFHRYLSNTITSGLVRLRTGAVIRDSQSGFRLISRRVLEHVKLQSVGFEAETEFLIKAAAFGSTFASLPIKTIYAGEKSNMTHLRTTLQFIRVILKRY